MPFAAGGNTDISAHGFGMRSRQSFGQRVLGREPASAQSDYEIGTEFVAKAGRPLPSACCFGPGLGASGSCRWPEGSTTLPEGFAHGLGPWHQPFHLQRARFAASEDLKEFIDYVKARPDSSSMFRRRRRGQPPYAGACFLRTRGLKMTHVAYKGGAHGDNRCGRAAGCRSAVRCPGSTSSRTPGAARSGCSPSSARTPVSQFPAAGRSRTAIRAFAPVVWNGLLAPREHQGRRYQMGSRRKSSRPRASRGSLTAEQDQHRSARQHPRAEFAALIKSDAPLSHEL